MKKFALLFCGVFSLFAFGQWTDNYSVNTLVSDDITSDISSIGTNDGKTYVIYWDETAGYVLKAQLLDADGNQLFGANGMVVNNTADMSTFTVTRDEAVDADGNAYISFTATGDGHGYANKISPTGEQLWGDAGIDLGENAYDTKVLPDGTGGAVIGWYVNGLGNLMKYDADGNPVWDAVKVLNSPDSSNPFTSVGELSLLPDGSFVVFMHVKGTSWMINSYLWAQRFAADGTEIWAAPIQVSNQTTAFNRRYEVLQDGDVTYLGYYGSTGFRFDSFLQRVNADGTLPWGINGSDFRTDDTHYEMTTSIAMEEGSDYIWAISDVTNDTQAMYGEFVQKFDKTTGARMLTDNAKEVFPINADSYIHNGNLQLVDDKPFFLGSTGIGDGVNPLQLFVSYLDENGDFAWDDEYIEIATTATAKTRVGFTKNVAGQSVAVWVENKGSGNRAYAQNYKIETVPEEDCDPVDIPYTQDFETAIPPDMPECTSVENAGAGNNWETFTGNEYGFTGTHLRYHWNVDNAANTWFFTQGINMQAGVTYKISYDYGSAGAALYSENLKIAYGASAESGAMNTTIADHPGILTGTLVSNTVEFEVDEDGVYYFGFNAYSDADMFYLFLDNIHIEQADTPPTGEDCDQGDDSNAFENGHQIGSGTDYENADDFYVSAENTLNVQAIEINAIAMLGPVDSIGFTFYEDDGGAPGSTVVATVPQTVPYDQVLIGSAFGYDVYAIYVDVDLNFEGGTSGASYWMQPTAVAPGGEIGAVFWEVTSIGTLGALSHTRTAGGPWVADPDGYNAVFKLHCEHVDPPTPPCTFDITNDIEPITRVMVSDIDHTSDATVNGSPALEDFTAVEGHVAAGESYDVALEGNTAGDFTTYFTIFVDWNQDGDMTDAGEMYEIGSITNSTGTDGQQATGNIAVPADAMEGATLMRVIKNFNTSPTNPCGTYGWGQAEDYTIVVGDGPVEPEDCSQSFAGDPNTGVGFINNGADVYVAANDINVAADTQFTVETISLDVVTLGGLPTLFDLNFYSDNGGVDQQVGSTQSAITPSNITPNGTFGSTGYPVYTVELTLSTPQLLQATTSAAAKYWIALSGYPSEEAANVYWVSYLYTDNDDSEPSWQSPDGGATWAEFANTNGEAVEGIMTVTGQCEQLGISDMNSFDFAYYPNPVKDVLNISSGKAIENVTAYNLAGQSVLNSAKVTNGQIDVSALPAGVYVFRVTLQGGQVETFKIVKK